MPIKLVTVTIGVIAQCDYLLLFAVKHMHVLTAAGWHVQDPTTRAFSAWGMRSGWGDFCDAEDVGITQLCIERSFEETFNAWHNSFARPECRFTSPVRTPSPLPVRSLHARIQRWEVPST